MYDEVFQGSGLMKTMIVESKDWAHFFIIKNVAALEP
jgi:hypothetical protein